MSKKSGATASFQSALRSEWEGHEQRYDPNTIGALTALKNCGIAAANGEDIDDIVVKMHATAIPVYGENNFISVCSRLVRDGICDDEDIPKPKPPTASATKGGKKKGGKKKGVMKKADMIRAQNTQKIINDDLDFLLRAFGNCRTIKDKIKPAKRCKFAETRLIALLHICKELLKNGTTYECYDFIMGIDKVMNYINKHVAGVSSTLCNVLMRRVEELKNMEEHDFSYGNVMKNTPELCFNTSYDKIFSALSFKPYDYQRRFIKTVADSIEKDKAVSVLLSAMIGEGKTSLAVALGWYIKTMRNNLKATIASKRRDVSEEMVKKSKMKIIFCCSVYPVRNDVARMAYNMGIPYAIGTMNGTNVKITKHYDTTDDNLILIITDIITAEKLLKTDDNCILFFDEPTVDADKADSRITADSCRTMMVAPKMKILTSATIPRPADMNAVYDYYEEKHPGSEIIEIKSNKSMIGCTMVDFDGKYTIPFQGCMNSGQLNTVIERLKTQPFIDRLLPSPLVYGLRTKMSEYISDLVDLEKHFAGISIISQNDIKEVGIHLLETLAEQPDDVIKDVCAFDDYNFGKRGDVPYNLDKILTTEAHRFLGRCLAVSEDPIAMAETCINKLVGKMNILNLIKEYKRQKKIFDQKMERISNMNVSDDEKERMKTQLEKSRPTIDFPSHLRVNTKDHLDKFCPGLEYDPKLIQESFPLDELDIEKMTVPEYWIAGLFAGVVIYTPYSRYSCKTYNAIAMEMMSSRRAAIIFSDISICYGVGYSLKHVLATEDFSDNHSIYTLMQLFGRVGRVGISWKGTIHVHPSIRNRFLSYCQGLDNINPVCIEGININNMFKKILNETTDNLSQSDNIVINKPTECHHNGGTSPVEMTELSKLKPQKDDFEHKIEPRTGYIPPHRR